MHDSFAHLRGALGDRYQPVRELGGGGMAQVYLAEDVKHQRQVAIKEIGRASCRERVLQVV